MLEIFKNRKGIILITAILIVTAAILVGFSYFKKDDTAAKVNGEAISKTELNSLLNDQYGAQVLDSLISEKLVLQEAKKRKSL